MVVRSRIIPVDRVVAVYNLFVAGVWAVSGPSAVITLMAVALHLLGAALPTLVERSQSPGACCLLPGRRFWGWRLRELYPMLLIAPFWSEIGSLGALREVPANDGLVIAADRWLFGMSPHEQWLPRFDAVWLSELMNFVYLAYFLAVFLPPLLLAVAGLRDAVRDTVLGLATIYLGCFAVYLTFPVEGPRHATEVYVGPHMAGFFYGAVVTAQGLGDSLGTAFPSSHVAGAVGIAIIAWRWLPRWIAVVLSLEATGVAFATVYTQNHYALDALAGTVWAFGAVTIARTAMDDRWLRASSLPGAVATIHGTTDSSEARPARSPGRYGGGRVTLVTGATGFIGRYVVRQLVARGERVRALVRDVSLARELLPQEGVELCPGDLRRPEGFRAATEGADAVVHLGAIARAKSRDPDDFERVNVRAVESLLAAASEAGVRRVVHVSTVVTLPPHRPAPINGASRELTAYERTKIAGERCVEEWVHDGHDAVVVHPTRVYGPGPLHDANGVSVMINQYLHGWLPVRLRDDVALANYVHAADVAAGIVLALEHGGRGRHYVLGGEENVSYRELLEILTKLSGVHRHVLGVPTGPVVAVAAAARRLGPLGRALPLTPGWVRILLEDRRVDIRATREELGYRPRPLERGLGETIEWLRQLHDGGRR
jgi:farnesol dehydrogenase